MIFQTMPFRLWLLLVALAAATVAAAEGFANFDDPNQAGFQLVAGRRTADLCIDAADFKVVQIAADCLSADAEW
jgi:hypothetical protein